MTTYTTKKAEQLAKCLAEQQAENERLLAEIEAAQEAHERRLAHALEKAGRARVALVEDLLEKFDVPPLAHEARRNKRTGEAIKDRRTGQTQMVDPDPDEVQRMQRLADAIDVAVTASRTTPTTPSATLADRVGRTSSEHAQAS